MSEASIDLKIGMGILVAMILLISIFLVLASATDQWAKRRVNGKEVTRDYCEARCMDAGYTESSCRADPWRFCFSDGTNP